MYFVPEICCSNIILPDSDQNRNVTKEEEEEFYKLRPANKTDHLCQSWQ